MNQIKLNKSGMKFLFRFSLIVALPIFGWSADYRVICNSNDQSTPAKFIRFTFEDELLSHTQGAEISVGNGVFAAGGLSSDARVSFTRLSPEKFKFTVSTILSALKVAEPIELEATSDQATGEESWKTSLYSCSSKEQD